jgi:hypothetical protein
MLCVCCVLQDELQRLKVDVKTADKTIQRLQCQSEQKAQEAGGLNIKVCCMCIRQMMLGKEQPIRVQREHGDGIMNVSALGDR